MDATLEQFINYIDNSARDKLENDDGVPEEADVADTYSQFYTAFAGIFLYLNNATRMISSVGLLRSIVASLRLRKSLALSLRMRIAIPG